MQTIKSIRQSGNKIRVLHYRAVRNMKDFATIHEIRKNKWQDEILSRGGKTVLELTTPDGKDFTAEAVCSKKDGFCRKTAISIAIGRLVKQMAA